MLLPQCFNVDLYMLFIILYFSYPLYLILYIFVLWDLTANNLYKLYIVIYFVHNCYYARLFKK